MQNIEGVEPREVSRGRAGPGEDSGSSSNTGRQKYSGGYHRGSQGDVGGRALKAFSLLSMN